MKIVFLALILVISTLADNTITVDCHQCGSVACIVLTGGGFNGKDMPISIDTCSDAGNFPLEIRLKCDEQQCSEGCMMTEIQGDQIVKFCTSTNVGQQQIVILNQLYRRQENDPTVSYDWCNCTSSLSALQIIKTAFRWFSPSFNQEDTRYSRQ